MSKINEGIKNVNILTSKRIGLTNNKNMEKSNVNLNLDHSSQRKYSTILFDKIKTVSPSNAGPRKKKLKKTMSNAPITRMCPEEIRM
jgi:hypothetical protein